MAINNFLNVVNASGGPLQTTVNGNPINIQQDTAQSTGLPTGEKVTVEISGTSVKMVLPDGMNSWSTLVYTSEGVANVFSSAAASAYVNY